MPTLDSRATRFAPGRTASGSDTRSPFRQDRDRILYSVEFQRLVGVTQVASPTERFPVHNRLTHTIKVAQVGRSIAERFLDSPDNPNITKDLDPDVVEAACLAHDLGHPPFGHNTERELDALLTAGDSASDGYEGNAQTFRIITTTAIKYPENIGIAGLNLTAATLNAVLKYPWSLTDNPGSIRKWGYYQSESEHFAFARAACGHSEHDRSPGLEAQIMNLADDISYAVHDVEDFVRAGLIPSGVFVRDSEDQSTFIESSLDVVDGASKDSIRRFLRLNVLNRFQGLTADYAMFADFRSRLVNRFITTAELKRDSGIWRVTVPADVQFEIDILQHLTRYFVIDSPSVQSQRFGQRRIVQTLFSILETQAESSTAGDSLQILPPLWHERIIEPVRDGNRSAIKRTIADYISSMTETQIVDAFQKLTGLSQGSIIDPIA